MPKPEEFQTNDPGQVYWIKVDKLRINEHEWENVELPMHYRADWKVVVDLTHFAAERSAGTMWPDWDDAEISVESNLTAVSLFIISSPLFFIPDGPRLLAIPTLEPMILGDEARCRTMRFSLLNPPPLNNCPITLIDRDGQTFDLAFPRHEDGFMIVDAKLVGENDLLARLACFIDFLTFLKGAYCGIGHGYGSDEDGGLCVQILGFNRHDASEGRYSWFINRIQGDLPVLFSRFSTAYNCELRTSALFRAIGFYRASNEARGVSVELAIISAHTALECLVFYILERMAGWSQKLMKDSKDFSDKMRAAISFLRISHQVCSQSPAVEKVAQTCNLTDGLAALSFIRNKLVHQDRRYVPDAIELHEAWLLMQWLVEVFIFAIIGHSGEFRDRRAYQGQRKTCRVSFAG